MNIQQYADRLRESAHRAGFRIQHYGRLGDIDLPVLRREAGPDAPEVYISTGVHGDEPSGPMAVLELLRDKAFPDGLNLTVFPMVNPTGLKAGTRENAEGIDLNRDYGHKPRSIETASHTSWIEGRLYDLVLCLHEDYEGEGFYIYAHQRIPSRHNYVDLALRSAEPYTGIDPRTEIDGMPADNGHMRPPDSVMNGDRPDMPEALRLHFHHGSRFTFTTETPSGRPLLDRIGAQRAVVSTILENFRTEELPFPPRDLA